MTGRDEAALALAAAAAKDPATLRRVLAALRDGLGGWLPEPDYGNCPVHPLPRRIAQTGP